MNADIAQRVKQFTEESTGIQCPSTPRPMTKEEVQFLVGMMVSELVELAQTVEDSVEDAQLLVINKVSTDLNREYKKPTTPVETAAHQADAIVDMYYYGMNAACKVGINLTPVMDAVHDANMRKKKDGKFEKRPDGKIVKPDGWTPPDIEAEIVRQQNSGSWN